MNNILEKIGEIADAWVKLDERIGFSRIIKYVALLLVVLLIVNFKAVTKEVIVFIQEISEQIHADNMNKRDKLMQEMTPVLQEFRTEVGADRLLYFEYHNSKENLVGIPFKYIDLVQQSTKYGIQSASVERYRDINVGVITNLYNDLRNTKIVSCNGEDDFEFLQRYPGTYEMFRDIDNSELLAFVSIPGIDQPVGLIVLEWADKGNITEEEIRSEIEESSQFVAIINGLILSNR